MINEDEDKYEEQINGLITYSDDDEDDFYGQAANAENISAQYDEEAEEIYEEAVVYEDSAADDGIGDLDEIDLSEYGFNDLPAPGTEKKKKHLGGIIGMVLCGAVLLALIYVFASVDTGIIGTYKANFANNFAAIFGNFLPDPSTDVPKEQPKAASNYKSDVKNSVIISMESAGNAEFVTYKEGVVTASANYLAYIDKTGTVVWEINTAIVEPLLAAEGNYILLGEKGRNKLCLYADKRLQYDVDDPDSIMAVKVSARGDAVIVTDKSLYRGGISVYNKAGEQIYSWASGHDAVISADISSASRRVAVALLNTEREAKSVIQFFDVNERESYSQTDITGTVIYDLRFTGSVLTAFGDNRLAVFADTGKKTADNELGDTALSHSAIDAVGNKLLAVDDGNMPMLNVYGREGELNETMALGGVTDFVDIEGKTVLYNIGRDIYFGKINGKKTAKYTATMDIRKLLLLSNDTVAIVYSNSLEVITI